MSSSCAASAPPNFLFARASLVLAPPSIQPGRIEESQGSVIVANQTTGMIVAQNAHVANTFISRLVGLLGRRELDSGEGLLILPCSGVHTLGMQFPIDVVALDKHDRVLRTWSRISPWRICGLVFAARSVLEVAAGVIEATGTKPGDQMQLQDA